MNPRPTVFFCDLNNKQITEAKAWSHDEGAMQRKPTLEKLSFMQNKSRTIGLGVNDIESLPSKSVDELSEHLIACACHIYEADRMVTHTKEGWSRKLEFHLGVHAREIWEANALLL